MRIGEFEDAVGKQFLARREGMTGDLARLGARLADPGHGAVRPAAEVPDSVVISAEARSPHLLKKLAELPLPPFPSPKQLIAVLKDLDGAATPERVAEAAARLAELVHRLVQTFPRGASPPPWQNAAAEQLVRALTWGVASPEELQALAKLLTGTVGRGPGSAGTLPATVYERAAVAILSAALHVRTESQVVPLAATPQAFPAALLSLLAVPPPIRRMRRKDERPDSGDHDDDEADDEEQGRRE